MLSLAHYCLSAEVAGPLRAAGAAADHGRRIADRICVIDVVEVTLSRYAATPETSDGG